MLFIEEEWLREAESTILFAKPACTLEAGGAEAQVIGFQCPIVHKPYAARFITRLYPLCCP